MNKYYIFGIFLFALLVGCSEHNSVPSAEKSHSSKEQDIDSGNKLNSIEPKLADYVQLNSGSQLVGLYWAHSKRNIDYNDAADALYKKYSDEKNQIIRERLLNDLKPEIDAMVEKSKNIGLLLLEPSNPYSWLGEYDAEYKNFPITVMNDGNTRYSFQDADKYSLSFRNQRAFSRFKVDNPELVERIEVLKRNFAFDVNVYVRIIGTQAGTNIIETEINKIQLLDKNRKVVLEIN